jgi:hypothetical protein
MSFQQVFSKFRALHENPHECTHRYQSEGGDWQIVGDSGSMSDIL